MALPARESVQPEVLLVHPSLQVVGLDHQEPVQQGLGLGQAGCIRSLPG